MHITAQCTISGALYFEKPDNQRSDWNDLKPEHKCEKTNKITDRQDEDNTTSPTLGPDFTVFAP